MLTTNLKRVADKIETFNKFGDTGNGRITRLSLSPEELEAREELCKRCRNLGMQIQQMTWLIFMLHLKAIYLIHQ